MDDVMAPAIEPHEERESVPPPLLVVSRRRIDDNNDHGHDHHDKTQQTLAAIEQTAASILAGAESPSPSALPRIEITHSRKSSLDLEVVEGPMVVHRKKPRKKLFKLHRSASYFVVADAKKPVLELYNSDARAELVYVLSLAGGNMRFESDDADIVMEKCFLIEVSAWKKRGVVFFRPQGFLFYEEDQARMLLWVKCIHQAIKRATAGEPNCAVFGRPSLASTVSSDGQPGDADDPERDRPSDGAPPPPVEDTVAAPRLSRSAPTTPATGHGEKRASLALGSSAASREGLAIDTSRSSSSFKAPPHSRDGKMQHFARLNSMFTTIKSPTNSPRPPEKAARSDSFKDRASQLPPKIITSLQMAKQSLQCKTSGLSKHHSLMSPMGGKRASDPFQCTTAESTLVGGALTSPPRPTRMGKAATVLDPVTSPVWEFCGEPPKSIAQAAAAIDVPPGNYVPIQTLDAWISMLLARCLLLMGACTGGYLQASLFQPIAVAGAFSAYVGDDDYWSTLAAAVAVYFASRLQMSLGVCATLAILYGWSYAGYKTNRRALRVRIADQLAAEEKLNFATVEIPNWLSRPDVDRVEWLNKVFTTGWPYLKIAIRDSLLYCLNPLLDSSRPAFMSSLSIVRIDLGTRTPLISGVKFVSANPKTDEVTLDVEVRIVTDESFVAELRMVSTLGATAYVTLRDLFLVGTLRITLNPLWIEWPCFSALSLSFTNRPAFDFSLTAAKINLSNVPFASEWLHTFLHDLLIDYFVWPKVVHVPLWENPSATSSTQSRSS